MALTQQPTSGWLLDTHTWVWMRAGTLTAKPEDLITLHHAAAESQWFVSSFSLSELAHAVARKRMHLDRPLLDWFNAALQHPGPRLLDITPQIATATLQLPATFHGDPGDRILAATAIAHNLTLCTHDDLLLRFGKLGLFRTMKINETKEPA
jgi:PIN domain nuclease of toxin-antitoxin system